MFLFSVATSCSFVALGNKTLKKWYGIILPSLPVSIFYDAVVLF